MGGLFGGSKPDTDTTNTVQEAIDSRNAEPLASAEEVAEAEPVGEAQEEDGRVVSKRKLQRPLVETVTV